MKKVFSTILFAISVFFVMSQSYIITNYTTSNSNICSDDILSVKGTSTGDVWFGSNGSGASVFDGTTWTTYTTSGGHLGSATVKGIIEDHSGNIWFATTGGVTKYTGSSWTTYDTGDGVPHNDVRCVYEDASGNIWIGTGGGGVAKTSDGGFSWTTYDTGDGLAHNYVQAITQGPDGDMWFATAEGLSRFDGLSSWTTYTDTNGLVANGNELLSACTAPDGKLWFGSKPGFGIGGGVSMYDGSTWTTYVSTPGGLASNQVMGIASDAKSRIWFATYVNGASLFKNLSSWSTYSTSHGLVSNSLTCVDVAPDGYVWIGSTNGVSKIATVVYHDVDVVNNLCGASNAGEITISAGTICAPIYYSIDDGVSYQASNTFTGLATGSYNVWITDSSMFINAGTVDIIDQPLGDAFPDTVQACDNDSTQLNPDSSFTSFTWWPDSLVSNTTIENPYIYPTVSQWIMVQYTDSNSCVINDSIYFDVLPAPYVLVNITDDSVFTCASTYTSYQWYRYDSLIPGATGQTYIANQPGNYYVCVVADNGCDACSGFLPYLNPGIFESNIDVHAYISGNVLYYDVPEEFNKIEVYSYDGRLLEATDCEGGKNFIVLQSEANGALFIRFSNEDSYAVKTLYR